LIARDWLVWQIVDSAFPIGGFAHSWGLESAWQHDEVRDIAALESYTRAAMLQTLRGVVPLMNAAYEAPVRVPDLDRLAEAFLTNPVANRASRVQGRTLVRTAARVWPDTTLPALDAEVRQYCGHFGPVAGVVFNALGVSLRVAQQIVLFSTARGVLSAAVRVGLVGSFEAQRLQYACAVDPSTLGVALSATLDDLAHTAPVADLLQARHDNLYSRLFQS